MATKKTPTAVSLPASVIKAMKRGLVPEDPNFFKVVRLLQGKAGSRDALRDNVWAYTSIAAVAKPISSVPFIFLQDETKDGTGEFNQPDAVESLVDRARATLSRNSPFDVEFLRHVAYQANQFDRYRSIRLMYPTLHPHQITRIIGSLKLAPETPWTRLFRRPNDHTTARQLVEETITILRTHGRCFWIMVGKTGRLQEGEIPTEIWPRTPAGWKADVEKGMRVTGWELSTLAGEGGRMESLKYKPHEVFLMRYVSPDNPLGGLSPLDPVKEEMRLDHLAQQYNVKFFENGATIGGVLVYPEPLGEVQEEIREEEFNAEKGGLENAHSTLVLGGGAKWYPNLVTQHDMEHKDTRMFARDSILASQRTPRAVVGLAEDHNKANQEAALRAHWDSNLVPEMTAYEDAVNSLIDRVREASNGTQPAIYGVFDLSTVEAFRESLWRKLKTANLLLMAGYPVNMVNERLGLGMRDVPWGNTWYRTNGTVPVNGYEEAPPPVDPNAEKKSPPVPDKNVKAGNEDQKKKEKVVKEAYEAVLNEESRSLFERISSMLNTKFRQRALVAIGAGESFDLAIDDLQERVEEDATRIARRASKSVQESLGLSQVQCDGIDVADSCRVIDFASCIATSLRKSVEAVESSQDGAQRQRILRDVLNRFTSQSRLRVACLDALGSILQHYFISVYRKNGMKFRYEYSLDCQALHEESAEVYCLCPVVPQA